MLDSVNAPEPAPKGEGRVVVDLVLKDLQERSDAGARKYGTPLRTENGRNALVDAYQEALDLTMYLRQRIEEDARAGRAADPQAELHGRVAADMQVPRGILFAEELRGKVHAEERTTPQWYGLDGCRDTSRDTSQEPVHLLKDVLVSKIDGGPERTIEALLGCGHRADLRDLIPSRQTAGAGVCPECSTYRLQVLASMPEHLNLRPWTYGASSHTIGRLLDVARPLVHCQLRALDAGMIAWPSTDTGRQQMKALRARIFELLGSMDYGSYRLSKVMPYIMHLVDEREIKRTAWLIDASRERV